jgi:hypothetical protein
MKVAATLLYGYKPYWYQPSESKLIKVKNTHAQTVKENLLFEVSDGYLDDQGYNLLAINKGWVRVLLSTISNQISIQANSADLAIQTWKDFIEPDWIQKHPDTVYKVYIDIINYPPITTDSIKFISTIMRLLK